MVETINLRYSGNMTFQQLHEELERQKESKKDRICENFDLECARLEYKIESSIEGEPDLEVEDIGIKIDEIGHLPMTELAQIQLATKLEIPVTYWNKCRHQEKLDLLTLNINEWLEEYPKRILVRTLEFGGIQTCRAFLSDRYRRIDNWDLLFATMDEFATIEKTNGTPVNIDICSLTLNNMYVRAHIPAIKEEIVSGDPASPAIVISNSEVGAGRILVEPMIVRWNKGTAIIGTKKLSKYHVGKKIDWTGILSNETIELQDKEMWSTICDYIRHTFDESFFQEMLLMLREAKTVELINPAVQIENFAIRFRLTDDRKEMLMNKFLKEGDDSKCGFVSAVTTYAAGCANMNDRIKLERAAGELLGMDGEKFNRFLLVKPRRKKKSNFVAEFDEEEEQNGK